MDIIVAIILGVIQGLTEFIPVSSTGHLLIAGELLPNRSEFVSFEFDVLLNIGTLTALLIHFRTRLAQMLQRIVSNRDTKLLRNIVISTIPAALAGFFFEDLFSDTLRDNAVVAGMLLSVGVLMIFEEKLKVFRGKVDDIKPQDALMIGVAQILALIPGTSRSGSTILAGRVLGFSAKTAAEYSFLIAIPIVSGAVARVLLSSEGASFIADNLSFVIVGNLASFISGYLAIRFMLAFLAKAGLKVFGYYRLGLAVLVLLITVVIA